MSQVVGICVGAMTLSVAEESPGGIMFRRIPHEGKVAESLKSVIQGCNGARIGITGRKFRRLINAETLPEPEAVELAFRHIRHSYPEIDCIISAGGESFLAYSLDREGFVRAVHTGNKCASGTGEFFLQQVRRMGLTLDEAVSLAAGVDPYSVASRCTVFCKSDCTHALNKGVELGRVTAGLCRMLAGKIVELLRAAGSKGALIVGGVSQNSIVIENVRKVFPNVHVPEEASCFEALGALRWVSENGHGVLSGEKFLRSGSRSFSRLPSLKEGLDRVVFSPPETTGYIPGENGEYVLGLDVGSTTTKAVLVDVKNRKIVSGVYLRTNGNPVKASRSCYRELLQQFPGEAVPSITGLGVTGSGRRIAGLHALTDTVINEIVAHAAAAVHFDPGVDTIFEIGGQDAKYTYLTNGVPTDYAMNEACSAGTGSFLEESCMESFGLTVEEIGDAALAGATPPNFNDQCSAFISSDIKTAMQEGLACEDIVAGLVYSVCQNYLARVKGNRRSGRKIFMQGGVCYNRAVPPAMATLCGTDIIVPPEPGLMGAFGAALETIKKLEEGVTEKTSFNLQELESRVMESMQPFTCDGGEEGCDRKCTIARYRVNGRVFPFGGACDRFNNLGSGSRHDSGSLDLVRLRERKLLNRGDALKSGGSGIKVGIPASLMTNTYFPLYAGFFEGLGAEVILSDKAEQEGIQAAGSAFCLPVLQSHGHVRNLLDKDVLHVFIPHIKGIPSGDEKGTNCTCPLVQGEPYIMKAAFGKDLSQKLVTAVIDFNNPAQIRREFIRVGKGLGFSASRSATAFDRAWNSWVAVREQMKSSIERSLDGLKKDEIAIVLFGRPYNAFSSQANLGIPSKFASRGYMIVPHDLINVNGKTVVREERMYWGSGRTILDAARMLKDRQNLFGVFITSFSCGPDSFIMEKFRNVMGDKPFLILELDSHTADAGVDTRIEAFLDVVESYRRIKLEPAREEPFTPARVLKKKTGPIVQTGNGDQVPVTDPKVHVLVPSMGNSCAHGIAAALRYIGVRATAAPPPGLEELTLGSQNASCKECMPYLLTSGSLKRYLRTRLDKDEVLLYLMPEADGPCRFGLYSEALRDFIKKERLKDVAVLSLTSTNGYQGLPSGFGRRALLAGAVADGFDDVRAGILAMARDVDSGIKALDEIEKTFYNCLSSAPEKEVLGVLKKEMLRLSQLDRSCQLNEVTRVLLTGEIYVRRDNFSNYGLVRRLAEERILVKTSPVLEWIFYIDHIVLTGILNGTNLPERLVLRLRNHYARRLVSTVQGILEMSGFFSRQHLDISFLIDRGKTLIDPRLTGEAILTIGSAIAEIGDDVHGVISISPFGCMPGRIAEAVIKQRIASDKPALSRRNRSFWRENKENFSFPFLALETDGKPMSQMAETKLESFITSVHRFNRELRKAKGWKGS